MKMTILFLFLSVQLLAQDSIPNQNLIDIINDCYDLTIDNEVVETWYLYDIPGGKWIKTYKDEKEVWLPYHRLTKIEIADNQIVKTIFINGNKQESILPLSFRDSLVALNISALPTFLENPLIKRSCSSELAVLIKCASDIQFYELPICPFIMVKDENIENFETLKLEAERIIEICDFFGI